jgi:hypothetical protein
MNHNIGCKNTQIATTYIKTEFGNETEAGRIRKIMSRTGMLSRCGGWITVAKWSMW